jgi:crotonobetainyl-CoA:carnitine CoA-transferase CaiB-like acyl-CoA transferase
VTAYYASLNRDKQSVVLDLKNPEGASVLTKLLEGADVFVTNMRPPRWSGWASTRRRCMSAIRA